MNETKMRVPKSKTYLFIIINKKSKFVTIA